LLELLEHFAGRVHVVERADDRRQIAGRHAAHVGADEHETIILRGLALHATGGLARVAHQAMAVDHHRTGASAVYAHAGTIAVNGI